jgi:hypothetical protein
VTGPDEDNIATADLDASELDGTVELLRSNGMAGLERLDTERTRHVEQHAARDHAI